MYSILICSQVMRSNPESDSNLVTSLGMVPCCGTQVYESFTEPGQSLTDSVHRPIPNVSSEAIVSGEAVYIDDIPSKAGKRVIMTFSV